MFKGEPKEGLEFYKLLVESEEFTSELGKVTLASGMLEAELIILLKRNEIEGKYKKATLGALIDKVKKNKLLDSNMIIHLRQVSLQRNYITHNIYALLSDLINETILERNNLLDADVDLYIQRAWQLKKNIIDLTDVIKKMNAPRFN